MPDNKKDKERKILCPECETEVTITRDEDGDDVGRCPNEECKLDVGAILTRRRYARADRKIDAAEVAEAEKKEKEAKKRKGGFWS